MNGRNEEGNYSNLCNIHPTKIQIGVCSLCLKERLVILLSTSSSKYKQSSRRRSTSSRKSHHIYVLQKVSALGSFLRRSESSRREQRLAAKSTDTDDTSTSTSSQEDSFISIKFEDNGNASWVKDSAEHCKPHSSATATVTEPFNTKKIMHNVSTTTENMKKKKKKMDTDNRITSIVEHHGGPTGSDGGAGMLRWRKRVGQVLFQLVRLKKSTMMESGCQDICSSNEGKKNSSSSNTLKIRNKKNWIKTMTKKRDHHRV
ncbi:hypothetical protein MKW98_017045 [Papaver atlanticum]|uniref:Uncharacterized protein n=1 Tax=Papaver atlanticum TaxID=357466 RepID=A0AAD4XVY6_9MAGN|nr:hypothetical protein MKW98_017045 [Papaver atlanticum]